MDERLDHKFTAEILASAALRLTHEIGPERTATAQAGADFGAAADDDIPF